MRESWRSTPGASSSLLHYYRGGANLRNDDDSEEEEVEEESDDEEEESDSEDSESSTTSSAASPKPSPSTSAAPPLTITIQTAMGNALLDESMEIPAFPRQKTVRAVKESIARRFSGKPPLASIQLLHDGIVLDDDTMKLEELVDDEDDEDDEDEDEEGSSKNKLTLHLDIVPTVDPKTFLVELDTKLADATTSELLDAFVLNEAALHHNYAALEGAVSEHEDDDEPVTQHIKDRAAAIRSRLEATLLGTDHAQTLLAESLSPNAQALVAPTLIERKGHRVRTPHASNRRVRRSLQQYLNVDWATLLKHTLLCFFFGTFGGKNKLLLFSLAPVLILLQTRPVKSFLKHALYALGTDPPGILLSLLPAPHQAILSFRGTDTMQALYGKHIVVGDDAVTEQDEDDEDAFYFDAEQFEGSDDESVDDDFDDDDEEEDAWSVADADDDYDDDDDDDDGDY